MKVTHQQIADAVGVSRTVVTHVLHRTPRARIGAETRSAVLKAAAELGYQPRDRATHCIGYVMSASQLRLESETAQMMHVEECLRAHGYRLTLATWPSSRPETLREVFNAGTVDGIIFNTWGDGRISSIPSPEMPWILLSDEDGVGPDVDLVAIDTVSTARKLTEHLLSHGHRRLCLIISLAGVKFHRSVIQGVREAMAAAGLEPDRLQLIRPYHVEETAADLLPLMAGPDAPTAIMTVTPGFAITTLYTLRCAGYRVPDDVSLVAMIDHGRYQALPPVLTSTDVLGEQYVERAVGRLVEKIRNRGITPQHSLLAGEVIARQSVGKPPLGKPRVGKLSVAGPRTGAGLASCPGSPPDTRPETDLHDRVVKAGDIQ